MRITNSMVSRNYTKNLNTNAFRLNKLNTQVITGAKFTTMSEDTASGVRAMQVRRNLQRIDAYLDNTKSAAGFLDNAESSLRQIYSLTQTASEKYIQAISDTCGPDERDIIAGELSRLREELLSLSNAKFSDRYMFGGTNMLSPPFTVENNTLFYNGADINTLTKTDELFLDAAYIDIGLGLSFSDSNDPQQVDSTSAFKYTLVGAEFLGLGSENLYNIMTEMIDSLTSGGLDHDAAGNILDRFQSAANSVSLQITKMGADSQYLEFTVNRLETEEFNLITRQDDLEVIPREEAILYYKMQEYVYNAALQMGTRLFQPTLFDFMR